MSGVDLTLELDEVAGGLDGMAGRIAERRPALRAIGQGGVSQTRRRFQLGRAPDGTPWKKGRKKTGQTLIKDAFLVRSIAAQPPSETGVSWGSNRVYAAIHQMGFSGPVQVGAHSRVVRQIFGRPTTPRRQDVKAHTRQMNMPARPYLGISAQDGVDLSTILLNYIGRGVLP